MNESITEAEVDTAVANWKTGLAAKDKDYYAFHRLPVERFRAGRGIEQPVEAVDLRRVSAARGPHLCFPYRCPQDLMDRMIRDSWRAALEADLGAVR